MFKRSDVTDIYSLSPMQEGMLFHYIIDKKSSAYFEQTIIDVKGKVDLDLVKNSLNKLIEKYDILRTVFIYAKLDKPRQVLLKDREAEVEFEDISSIEEAKKIEAIRAYEKKDKEKGFDLQKDIPMRISMIKTHKDSYKLIWSFHHIIMDGWCLAIIIRDFLDFYISSKNGKDIKIISTTPYSSYIKWLEERDKCEGIEYWKEYLKDYEEQVAIPKFKATIGDGYKLEEQTVEINKESTEKLMTIAKKHGVTINTIFEAVWGTLLSRYNNTKDIVFGSVVAGRSADIPDIENMVGLFINTIPIRIKYEKEDSFIDIVRRVQEKDNKSRKYDYIPLAEIQSNSELKQGMLNHVMAFENYPVREKITSVYNRDELGFSINNVKIFEHTNYDFSIVITPRDSLNISFKYNSAIYDKESIDSIGMHLLNIVKQVLEDEEIKICDIQILTEKEKGEILYSFNDTAVEYHKNKTIVELFEEQVDRIPESIAVVYEDKELTYSKLNERANSLARELRDRGVQPETIVGIMVERSLEMVVGILGILKAGGAYVPIDPDYPEDRIEFMLKDSSSCILLTQDKFKDGFKFKGEIIDLQNEEIYIKDRANLNIINNSTDLAYIIYTSGSTGKPKGVLIEHKSIINTLSWRIKHYNFNQDDKVLQIPSFSFDSSVEDIFTSLISGAKLILICQDKRLDLEYLKKVIEKNRISHFLIIPSLYKTFLNEMSESLKDVRKVTVAGESCSSSLVEKHFKSLENVRLYNEYGPTENSVCTTVYEFDKNSSRILIGKPNYNTKCYILNKYNKPQPIGVAGELCISGVGLARGYLNRPELTAEKFVENPFVKGERMYKTGDLARWLPDGNIEFLGRIDHQVKIRGYRIELGEIENIISKQKGVKEVVVLSRKDNMEMDYLCAYIVKEEHSKIEDIKEEIKKELPDYMIPSVFIELNNIPLTPNGKIHRKTLLEIEVKIKRDRGFEGSINETEARLIGLWEELLGIEGLGINDNFFDIGGHSLKATILSVRIQKELGTEISVRDIFEYPNIKALAKKIQETATKKYKKLEALGAREYYSTSSAQRRVYAIQMMDKKSTSYNISLALELTGKVNKERIEFALEKLIQKHEVLRTSFYIEGKEIVQKISHNVKMKLEYISMNEYENIAKEKKNNDIKNIIASWIRPFDLGVAPLIRGALIKVESKYVLMLDMHHIISDGATMGILAEDFVKAYSGEELKPSEVQYKEYATWEKEQKIKGKLEKQREYWKQEYEGEIPLLELPTHGIRGGKGLREGKQINFEIEEKTIRKLKKRMAKIGGTLYMGLMAGFNILLSKYSGLEDIIVGMPIAGRRHSQMEKVAGMFVNTLAIRSNPMGDKKTDTYLREVKEKLLKAYENQEYPYEELVEEIGVKRDLNRNPLFDVMLVLQNTEMKEMGLEDIKIKPYEIENGRTKFDITLLATEFGEKLACSINYRSKLFKTTTIENMIKHYIKILKEISEEKKRAIKDIELLEKDEKEQLLINFNNTKMDYPKDKTIQELFEKQVEKAPDNIAVIYEDKELTYSKLNEKANSLARELRARGVQPDTLVGIMVERSLEMIVGIMAILKAGGAYVPIDSDYPRDRIKYMLDDSSTNILLSQEKLVDRIKFEGEIIDLKNEEIYNKNTENLNIVTKPTDLAYVIYTSGSTGKPKGVMLENRGIANFKETHKKNFGINDKDKILQFASLSFDASVGDIFKTLLNGAQLHILDKNIINDYSRLENYIEEKKITIATLPPTYVINLDLNKLKNLKCLITAGSEMSADLYNKLKSNNIRYSNAYGPTEATICATIWKSYSKEIGSVVPIGKPISNTKIYILDKNNKLQPFGVSGELCISGEGLSRGYLNKEELTKEKFVENPFIKGKNMYKTGDLARWLPDGNIEFLGRIDHQVKIRGYRIELGEIENTILKQEGVKEVVVLSKKDNMNMDYLCAYLVKEEHTTIESIKEEIKKELPDYMIPNVFIELNNIPLTSNGKIHRKALLEIEVKIKRDREFEGSRNEIEARLVGLWEELLGIENIGINDNFFDIGGHSLKATILSGRIQKELGAEISVRDIFEYPNIKALAKKVQKTTTKKYKELEALEAREYYSTSSAQRRMYAIQVMNKESTAYNMPLTLELRGKVDRTRIEQAIEKLISKHEALRTSFYLEGDEVVQKIEKEIKIELDYARAEKKDAIEKIIVGWIKPFNLGKAPLLRGGIIKTKDSHILMLDMHHIISDGTTMGILAEDFVKAYEGIQLDIEAVQYKEYALWEKQQKENGVWDKQRKYWKQEYAGKIPVLELPLDGVRGGKEDEKGSVINFEIEESITKDLRKRMSDIGGTLYMGLMAGYSILMSRYSGMQDIVIGIPIAGRRHPQLEKVAGIFINTLAIRTYPDREKLIIEYLKETKQKLLKAYENQEYPYEELVEEVGVKRDYSRNPLFDVMLDLHNSDIKEMRLSEIEVEPYVIENNTAKFDLSLTAVEANQKLICNIEYKINLFERETIEAMIGHYKKILKEISAKKDKQIKDIELLEEWEKKQILIDFNNTQQEYQRHKIVQKLFEEQVNRTPNDIAVVSGDIELTYQELNEKANSLANELRHRGVKPGTIVGIMVERSLEMIIGVIGIIKSGGAYLPIDPKYPEQRINHMIRDSKLRLLIAQRKLLENKYEDIEIIDIKDKAIYSRDKFNPILINKPDDLLYVIYTSGSTGKPKGVMIEHRNYINITYAWRREYKLEENKAILLQMANFAFDVFSGDLSRTLLNGGKLIICPEDIRLDLQSLYKLIEENEINIFESTPALIVPFMDYIYENNLEIKKLRTLIMGSDKCKGEDFRRLNIRYGNKMRILNSYGVTEATIDSSYYEYEAKYIKSKGKIRKLTNVPIGKPMQNTKFYILDSNNKPNPIRVPGELCISGEGIGRGYLNRPDLTNEKFVENPFVKGERMYKTGDLARWLCDGNVEFLGRMDCQIKVRGYRIELGEIENALLNHEDIKQAVVIARKNQAGDNELCVYIVANKDAKQLNLKDYLRKSLPEYMVPAYFIKLNKMPVTPNGKIDRKALLEIEISINSGVEYQGPRNKKEEILIGIWEEILSAKSRMGINDNFFEIGGDSIKAIQIAARLQKYKLKLDIQNLFQYPTIKQLSGYVKDISKIADQSEITGVVQLTPIQSWFFEAKITDNHHWNQSVMLYRKEGFEGEILYKAFNEIIKHHDALRMIYEEAEEKVKQVNKGIKNSVVNIEIYDVMDENHEEVIKQRAEELQSSINLTTGSLVKIGLFNTNIGDYLLIAIHHLVIDGVSWRIILEDFTTAYEQLSKGESIELPLKTTSFKEWAKRLKEYSISKELLKEKDYWMRLEEQQILSLPKNNEISQNKLKDSNSISIALSKEETKNLLKEVNRAYNTEINDILLAGFGLAVKEWAGLDKVLLELEGHGREGIIKDIDITRTVGWFTSEYPVILNVENINDIATVVKETKESLRRIPKKGIGYGILKYLTPKKYKEEIDFTLDPEISFNYLGQFDGDVNNHLFDVGNVPSGKQISPSSERHHRLVIIGIIANEALSISVNYNKYEYSEENIINLMEKYKKNLQRIIKHCIDKEESEMTLSDFTASDLDKNTTDVVFNKYPRSMIRDIYSLSPMQEGMLFHYIIDRKSSAYIEQTIIDVNGKLDLELVENSFNKLIEKYDVLRTVFIHKGLERPRQILLKRRKAQIDFKDVSWIQEDKKDEAIQVIMEKDRDKGFNLEKDIPMRISILKTGKERYKLIWNSHHIIVDGWCLGIIIGDFLDFYISSRNGRNIKISPINPYSEYIKWIERQDDAEGLEYWKNYLEGYKEQASIPMVSRRSADKYITGECNVECSRELTEKLKNMAKKNRVTINTLIEALWGILLGKYNNNQDVVFGIVVAGRSAEIPDIEKMVGLFINTIPVRVKYSLEDTFVDLINNLQSSDIKSRKYDYMPLAEIQSNSSLKQQLINHVIAFENYPIAEKVASLGVESNLGFSIKNIESLEHTNYDFGFIVMPGDCLNISFKYNSAIYDFESINRIGMHLMNITKMVIEDEEIKISDIEIVTKKEKEEFLYSFNNTKVEYDKEKTIQQLFEEQVHRTPQSIAVVFEDKRLTYKQLNQRANAIGRLLRSKGVKPDNIVGIMLDRSTDMIVAIMGVLKSGGAYLPIDPQYPMKRIEYMIEDSNIDILITKEDLIRQFNLTKEIINIEDISLKYEDTNNLEIINKATDLAYVIYTSGSTGKPKGVMIEHRNISNVKAIHRENFEVNEEDKILQFASYSFDSSVWEIAMALLNGGELHVLSKACISDNVKFVNYIEEKQITIATLPPAYLGSLDLDKLKTLKYLGTAGSEINVDLYRKLMQSEINYFNGYGPTEGTICTTIWKANEEEIDNIVPIGKPMSNISVYVINKDNKLQPIGAPGELYISGDSLARGYLNRPKLTQERFIENPYIKGERIYKTGDLARWLPNGNIEFLGRIDSQVKIRGYRIEPGEIENVLGKHPDLRENVIVTKEDSYGNKYLAAYVIPKNHNETKINDIYDYIRKRLPGYMLPSRIIILSKFPLTPNGKIDRLSLSKSDNYISQDQQLIAPRDYMELEMLEIWQGVLGIEKISMFDNFFTLGGHSITAMVLINKIRRHFNVELPLTQVFESPTIAQISDKVRENRKKSNNCLVTIERGDSSSSPLFIVHPHGGAVFCYFDLVKALGEERTVYGIQAVGVDSDEQPLTSIELMAARYIEEIKGAAPIGPYCIAGWSSGGTIAFEIARQLEELGEEIEFIGIIDSPSLQLKREYDIQEDLPLFVKLAILIEMDVTQFNGLEEEKISKLVIRHLNEMGFIPQGASKAGIIRVAKVILNTAKAINDYKSNNKISSDIHLFYATEQLTNNKQSLIDTIGWDNHTAGRIKLIPVPGNHATMMEPPNVASLAKAMKASLNSNVNSEEVSDIS